MCPEHAVPHHFYVFLLLSFVYKLRIPQPDRSFKIAACGLSFSVKGAASHIPDKPLFV
jgi:hypothetical protein